MLQGSAGDNLLLAMVIALPVVLAAVAYVLFARLRVQRRGRRWLWLPVGNGIVVLLLLSLLLLAGEVYYRYVYDTTDSFALTRVTQRWNERYYHTNAAGVRDSLASYDLAKRAGVRRVTFVGDSFTAGHGVRDVEDRFANRIRAAQPTWEVHVMASRGLETGDELARLTQLTGRGYELGDVVLVYCLNDVADLLPRWRAILDRLYDEPSPGWLVQHSFALNTWYHRLRVRRDPDLADYYAFVRAGYEPPIWDKQRQRLVDMRELVASQGGRLSVVIFPFLHALGDDYAFADAHRALHEAFDDMGVPYLDLIDVYEDHPPGELVVNAYDAHPNERAHALAAEAIERFLLERR